MIHFPEPSCSYLCLSLKEGFLGISNPNSTMIEGLIAKVSKVTTVAIES